MIFHEVRLYHYLNLYSALTYGVYNLFFFFKINGQKPPLQPISCIDIVRKIQYIDFDTTHFKYSRTLFFIIFFFRGLWI